MRHWVSIPIGTRCRNCRSCSTRCARPDVLVDIELCWVARLAMLPLAAYPTHHGCSNRSGEVAEFRGGQCGRAGIPGRAAEAPVKPVFEQIGILGRAAAEDNPVRPED